jgi:hypothetical protein
MAETRTPIQLLTLTVHSPEEQRGKAGYRATRRFISIGAGDAFEEDLIECQVIRVGEVQVNDDLVVVHSLAANVMLTGSSFNEISQLARTIVSEGSVWTRLCHDPGNHWCHSITN